MLLKALDLLRTIGWGIIDFIYSLINSLYDILKEINALDIINSMSNENLFKNFHTSIITISITLFGLFSIWSFVKKIIDPDEFLSINQIVKEIIKCGFLILLSTFLFVESSTLSIKLSGFTSTIFSNDKTSLGDSILIHYVGHSDSYKASDEYKFEHIDNYIKNNTFTNKKIYNDKFITSHNWILPDERDYKYSINWIMAIIVGGFFLYALFFSGMMLARRQIEFLFLFIISPIVFATSIGNKQRRNAITEQLVSLILQGAVVMMIIGLTAMLMNAIESTTFFPTSPFKDIATKSILYIGCGTFLLTGSQVVNRFIGGNVSANSGREQLMSMLGFGQAMKGVGGATALAGSGAGLVGLGTASSVVGKLGGNKLTNKIGKSISGFGKQISNNSKSHNSPINKIGNTIEKFGKQVSNRTPSQIGKNLRSSGYSNIGNALNSFNPAKNMYRTRYRSRGG